MIAKLRQWPHSSKFINVSTCVLSKQQGPCSFFCFFFLSAENSLVNLTGAFDIFSLNEWNRLICYFIQGNGVFRLVACHRNFKEGESQRVRKSANVTEHNMKNTLRYDLVCTHFSLSHLDRFSHDVGFTIETASMIYLSPLLSVQLRDSKKKLEKIVRPRSICVIETKDHILNSRC